MLNKIIYPSLKRNTVFYLFLALIVLEFILFRSYVLKNITDFYPSSFDQTSYLLLTYRIYESIQQQGVVPGILHSEVLPTGIFFPIQAALFYVLFGASRLSALLPNFLYFALLQLFALLAIQSFSNKKSTALIFLGLLLCIQAPFLNAGDIGDFRMDFIAFCTYGMFVCAAIKSRTFLTRTWSVIAGLVACIAILLRCITVVYFTPIIGLLFIYLLYQLKISKNSSTESTLIKTRLINLLLVGIMIGATALPYLWLNREAIYTYYVGSHVLGNEKYIRALEVGVTNTFSTLSFYPNSLFSTHIGDLALEMAGLIFFVYILYFLLLLITGETRNEGSIPSWKMGLVLLLLCILIPLIALTADTNKSTVVGSIMAIPCLWLFFWFCLPIDAKLTQTPSRFSLLNLLAVVVLCAGLYNLTAHLAHHPSKQKLQNVTTITKMYQDIGDYALKNQWPAVNLSVDHISDYLTAPGLAVVYYETRNRYIQVDIEKLGGTIFAINEADVLSSLKKSNVVILNLNPYPEASAYPFNQTITALKPLILSKLHENFVPLGDYQFMDSTYRVYVVKNNTLR